MTEWWELPDEEIYGKFLSARYLSLEKWRTTAELEDVKSVAHAAIAHLVEELEKPCTEHHLEIQLIKRRQCSECMAELREGIGK